MDCERKKMVCQVEEIDATCLSPEFDSIHGIQTRLVKVTLILSVSVALTLFQLHHHSGNGKRVTPRIFQGCPSVFEAFVICVIFSYTCSFSWLFIRNKPKFATFRRFYFIYSMVFMALALSILASALFLQNFSLVFLGTRLWHLENFRLVFRNLNDNTEKTG
ncbi:hypothetical protein Dsin_018385 [Dipteronia sinensis]|uniref:Uncharacterized protein n=1 Tax=Dipteronia sinensis TaxID=43782 RepID=A0AAE0A632_9ROSI|nr:hypothetical protein Dsin_018385 [Dipteronia sinensis]